MTYGLLLPLASLMSTVVWIGLFVLAALTAGASLYFFTRARHREAVAPSREAETSRAISEMRSVGDRIETLVSQQQLQGETQRARLGQQIESVQQTVSQQGHRVDGLRAELHSEVQRRDAELQAIRQQLADIQTGATALPPAAETRALPPAAPAPAAETMTAPEPVATSAPTADPISAPLPPAFTDATFADASFADSTFTEEPSGDSFAGAEALPPPPPVAHDPFADAALPAASPLPAADPAPAAAPAPAAPPSDFAPASDFAPPAASAAGDSMFSDMGFDAFAPGEPAGDVFPVMPPLGPEASAPAPPVSAPPPSAPAPPPSAPEPAAPKPTYEQISPAAPVAPSSEPTSDAPSDFTFTDFGADLGSEPSAAPDGGAWIAAPRAEPDAVPVFSADDDWDVPAEAPAPVAPAFAPVPAPPVAPEPVVAAFVPPDGADDFSFISTITEDVQRALYMAGVTKLEEVAHWSRGDARRVSAQVGVSEETIMNQWVFEAQGALFERYSSGVGG